MDVVVDIWMRRRFDERRLEKLRKTAIANLLAYLLFVVVIVVVQVQNGENEMECWSCNNPNEFECYSPGPVPTAKRTINVAERF